MTEASDILIQKGLKLLKEKNEPEFLENAEANGLLLDLKKTSHAYILGCVVDRQIPAERAWMIPYKVKKLLGTFNFKELVNKDQYFWEELFVKHNLHRFNIVIADCFYEALQKIKTEYNSNGANIWLDKPTSKEIVKRFLAFKGVGPKIATMAVNILVRKFGIELSDYNAIDISADVQVRRVFVRLGFSKTDGIQEVILAARRLYPDYPGVFDFSAWEIGKEWCRPQNPACSKCYLNDFCPKNF